MIGNAPARELYLVIDQGGHASRAMLFNLSGEMRAEAFAAIATVRPQHDWVEHDPEMVVSSVRDVIAKVLAHSIVRSGNVIAAGLGVQRSSIVCWDRESGIALSPVISWQDRRHARWLDRLAIDPERVRRATGLVVSPHYGASKLRWCVDHLSAVQEALRDGRLAFGPLASFLLFRLLVEAPLLCDPANASRTLLWNYRTLEWDKGLLEMFGLPREPLPACSATRGYAGMLRDVDQPIPMTVVTGDQSAVPFAMGAPVGDRVYVNVGTGAFVQRLVGSEPLLLDGLLSGILRQDGERTDYVLEGTVNGAGSALESVAVELGIDYRGILCEADNWWEEHSELPLFLNGVSGLGSPYWVSRFPSRFIGSGDVRERILAVLESIVFLVQANIQLMQGAGPLSHIVMTGGLAQNDSLCQGLASLSGLTVLRPEISEATARGLAWLVAGQPGEWGGGALARFEPKPSPWLERRFDRWRSALYDALAMAAGPATSRGGDLR